MNLSRQHLLRRADEFQQRAQHQACAGAESFLMSLSRAYRKRARRAFIKQAAPYVAYGVAVLMTAFFAGYSVYIAWQVQYILTF